jgi:hypothetical protein
MITQTGKERKVLIMCNKQTKLNLAIVLIAMTLCMAGVSYAEPMGTAFTYQGRLVDANSPADGLYDFEFGLFDDSTAGSQKGETVIQDDVDVLDGYFTVLLNFADEPNTFTGDARWLEVAVRPGASSDPCDFVNLNPRNKVTPAPYALALPGLRTQQNATSTNLIGGYSGNSITSGVIGATIGGGGAITYPNKVTDDYGTVCGGRNNQAGDNAGTTSNARYATVGGGQGNAASDFYDTVGGGLSNTTDGGSATVGGGYSNTADYSYATVGGGYYNIASGYSATVGGGGHNTASSYNATIPGGHHNIASGSYATVGGGYYNTASGNYATVAGGYYNVASSQFSTVGGGNYNDAGGDYATVAGGYENTASSHSATVGGGHNNTASGIVATVGGGQQNTTSGARATVGGGYYNTASGARATVPGGDNNTASGARATVGGGEFNTASGPNATVGGGEFNTASGSHATVPGGKLNVAGGTYSFAAGHRAKVRDAAASGDGDGDEGTFVWADSTDADFTSTGPDQFLILASGGVGIGTASPQNQLDVEGSVALGATYSGTNTAPSNGLIVEGNVGIGTSSPTGKLDVRGDEVRIWDGAATVSYATGPGELYVEGDLEVDGNIYTTANIYHDGDTNTQLSFSTDRVMAYAGGEVLLDLRESTQDYVKLGDGGDVDINLNDDMFIEASSGNVCIATTNPLGFKLAVNGSAGKPGGGSWSNYSDHRLKKNIEPLAGALDRMLQLEGVSFEYIDPDHFSYVEGQQLGMIAQEVEKVFPDWVDESGGYKTVTYRGFEAITVEAFRQLRKEKDTEISALKERLAKMEAALGKLIKSNDGGQL